MDWAWTDELAFCGAGRALRFNNLPRRGSHWKSNLRCAFRRLMSDGAAVTRLEVGLSYNSAARDLGLWNNWDRAIDAGADPTQDVPDIDPLALIEHIIALPTQVPLPEKKSQRPLLTQGTSVARLFLSATCKKNTAVPWHQHVGACPPVVLVECRALVLTRYLIAQNGYPRKPEIATTAAV